MLSVQIDTETPDLDVSVALKTNKKHNIEKKKETEKLKKNYWLCYFLLFYFDVI